MSELGPKIGDVTSIFPGHRAVFRGEWCMGIPVYETELPEPLPFGPGDLPTLLMKLPRHEELVDWTAE